MAQHDDLADKLRDRILNGEYELGAKIPSINSLQIEYGIRSLNTVRQAQQILVAEGLLETRHGIGAFVVSLEPVSDPTAELTSIRDQLNTVLAALESGSSTKLVVDVADPNSPLVGEVLQQALQGYVDGAAGNATQPSREHLDTATQLLSRVMTIRTGFLPDSESDLVERIRGFVAAAGDIGTADLAAKTVGIKNVEKLFRYSRTAGIVIDSLGRWSLDSRN